MENVPNVPKLVKHAENYIMLNRPEQVQPIGFDDARMAVWEIGRKKLEILNRSWNVRPENREVIRNVIKYFINDPSCTYDLNKGLYLFGGNGVGKTFLMDVMQLFCKVLKNTGKEFEVASTLDIVENIRFFEKYGREGDEIPFEKYCRHRSFCFDDLGAEQCSIRVFGNNVTVMETVLTRRYRGFTKNGVLTHLTSNDTMRDLANKYGSRVVDRLNEMCTPVFISGESMRL